MTRTVVLPAGTIKRIHVDRRVVAANRKLPAAEHAPAITVQTSRGALKGRLVNVHGGGTMVSGEKPLKCGARIWFETRASVAVVA